MVRHQRLVYKFKLSVNEYRKLLNCQCLVAYYKSYNGPVIKKIFLLSIIGSGFMRVTTALPEDNARVIQALREQL